MSQAKPYSGCRVFVTCPTWPRSSPCRGRVRTTGFGMVAGRSGRLYECERGHKFGLGITHRAEVPGNAFGELDVDPVSGESVNPLVHSGSGESDGPLIDGADMGHRHGPLCVKEDGRPVVLMPSAPPAFGDSEYIPRRQASRTR